MGDIQVLLQLKTFLGIYLSFLNECDNSSAFINETLLINKSGNINCILEQYNNLLQNINIPKSKIILNDIVNNINNELNEICIHNVEEDDIEYSIDKHKHIKYCTGCHLTLT